jgi:hypothetical protein
VTTPDAVPGPVSAPESELAPDGFPFEARLWRAEPAGGWTTIGWCASRDFAETLVESAMRQGGYTYGEVWGPSRIAPGRRVAVLRFDVTDPGN